MKQIDSAEATMKSCWVDWTRWTSLINCLTFRLITDNSLLGYPHFSAKKQGNLLLSWTCAGFRQARIFLEILCGNYIHWSSDLLKIISKYMLLVFVVTQCCGPPWKSSFNLVIDEGHLSVSGDFEKCSKYGCFIHHGRFCLLSKYHYTKMGHMVVVNSWKCRHWTNTKVPCLGQIIWYPVSLKYLILSAC